MNKFKIGDIVIRKNGVWGTIKPNTICIVDGFANTTGTHLKGAPDMEYHNEDNLVLAKGLEIDLFLYGIRNIPDLSKL